MSVDQINIEHLPQHIGKSVTLKGWVSNKREGKGIAFIVLRDGTGYCQCVVTGDNSGLEQLETAQSTSLETSVIIQGLVKSDDKQIGGIEVEVSEISIVGNSTDYPISKKEHGVEFLMDKRHLWLRSSRQWAIMRIRNTIIFSIHNHEYRFLLCSSCTQAY